MLVEKYTILYVAACLLVMCCRPLLPAPPNAVTFSFQQTLTATMTYAKEFSYSEKAVAEIGIPFLNKASVEVRAAQ